MRIVPISEIEEVQAKLQKRMDRLLLDLAGKPLTEFDERVRESQPPSRRQNSNDVREAVEEFMITLRDVKATFGKR